MPNHVLLTGVTGFIAKRIALDLLNAGHTVKGTLRNDKRADEVRDAIRPHLTDASALDRLSFIELDLTSDNGWTEAAQGCDVLMHTASPYPLASPNDEEDLIRPAVDGTLRALKAAHAALITRVILTSSVAAIEANDVTGTLTPEDWTDVAHPKATSYYKSKTLAEKAAWDFVAEHPTLQLTTINPALVLGAPLDSNYGSSLEIVERLMKGADPMLPDLSFGIVDVEDVSAMHIAAMDKPEAIGQRFIGSAGIISMPDAAKHLAQAYPDKKITTRTAPLWLLRGFALFDPSIKTILPQVGARAGLDTSATTGTLGITFTPVATAIDRSAATIA